MSESGQGFSPERAEAVWRRAAQLQAEAAQRMEERSRALAVRGHAADPRPHDFSLDEVRAAALEAGIAPEFVALAVREVREEGEAALTPRQDAAATRVLGVSQRILQVTRTIERPAEEVYQAMQRVLPAAPWHLFLGEVAGDPLAGGTLVFDVPPYVATTSPPLAYHALAVDVKQLQFTLRPLPGGACEVSVGSGLSRSIRRNYRAHNWFTGVLGVLGAGGATGGAIAAGMAGALLALPAVGGAVLLGGLTAVGYRVSYRSSLRKLEELLGRMLQGIDSSARTGGAFAAPAFSPGAGPGSGGDDGTATAAVIPTTMT